MSGAIYYILVFDNWSISLSFSKPQSLSMASKDSSMDDMVKALSSNPAYKVLTKEEYDILMSKHAGGSPKKADPKVLTSTPDAKKVQFEGAGSKLLSFINKGQAPSPVPRFTFNNTLPHNTSYVPSPYVPKLPTFSGSEEPQKGETTYEVWSLEVKCLQSSSVLPEPILLQSIRNSLKGSARSLLVPLEQNATVADILAKLDGFYANVSSSETLIQSFYSDYQKEAESVVSFASRIEQTLSRAVKSGHIDGIAKDAMLRSKFWTGLKSQSLKNSTRHLYHTIKDFPSLLHEIRKVDQEENSFKQTKKPTAQQQQCNQVTSDSENNTDVLLKSMKELMSRMEKMEERLDQQTKQSSESVGQSNFLTPILISMFHEAVDVLVIEVTFRRVVMVGAIKVAQTIATTTLTVTIMLTRIIILKEAIEVVVVLGVVTVVVPTAVVLTMVKMLGTI